MADHQEAPAWKETLLCQGPVRAGRRRRPAVPRLGAVGEEPLVTPEPPAEGGPNQHNAPAPRGALRARRETAGSSRPPTGHCVWMSGHLPPCLSAEMSSEHIRTFQVAQKLPRCQSP